MIGLVAILSLLVIPSQEYGNSSTKARYNSPLITWQSFPVLYFIDKQTVPNNLIDGITDAFDTYNKVAESIFYQRSWDENDSKIHVSFGNIDGKGHTVGRAEWSSSSNPYEMSNATIKFDSSEKWANITTMNSTVFNIGGVATHEIGHISGLAHADDDAQTMYYNTAYGETLRRILGNGDKNAFKTIYNLH